MPKVIKPAPIRLPERYSLLVLPSTTVKVGTQINIRLTYQTGKAEDHRPSLELLRDPETHPEIPQRLPSMQMSDRIAYLEFTVNKLGTYAFNVKPFLSTDFGQLVEIHTISSEEDDSLKRIADRFAQRS